MGLMASASFPITALALYNLGGFAYDPDRGLLYLAELSSTQLQYCGVQSDQRLWKCATTGPTIFSMPSGVAFVKKTHTLYVVDKVYQALFQCTLSPNGQISDCIDIDSSGEALGGVAVEPNGRYLYLTHPTPEGISICDLDSMGHVSTCQKSKTPIQQPQAIAINHAGSTAYILSEQTKQIWSCKLRQSTGQLAECLATMVDATYGTSGVLAHNIYATVVDENHEYFRTSCGINESDELAYVNEYADGSAYRCLINQNTADFKQCFRGGNPLGYAAPLNLAVSADDTHAYIYSAGSVQWDCTIRANGVAVHCTRLSKTWTLPWDQLIE